LASETRVKNIIALLTISYVRGFGVSHGKFCNNLFEIQSLVPRLQCPRKKKLYSCCWDFMAEPFLLVMLHFVVLKSGSNNKKLNWTAICQSNFRSSIDDYERTMKRFGVVSKEYVAREILRKSLKPSDFRLLQGLYLPHAVVFGLIRKKSFEPHNHLNLLVDNENSAWDHPLHEKWRVDKSKSQEDSKASNSSAPYPADKLAAEKKEQVDQVTAMLNCVVNTSKHIKKCVKEIEDDSPNMALDDIKRVAQLLLDDANELLSSHGDADQLRKQVKVLDDLVKSTDAEDGTQENGTKQDNDVKEEDK
jgi:hypothetical protein